MTHILHMIFCRYMLWHQIWFGSLSYLEHTIEEFLSRLGSLNFSWWGYTIWKIHSITVTSYIATKARVKSAMIILQGILSVACKPIRTSAPSVWGWLFILKSLPSLRGRFLCGHGCTSQILFLISEDTDNWLRHLLAIFQVVIWKLHQLTKVYH